MTQQSPIIFSGAILVLLLLAACSGPREKLVSEDTPPIDQPPTDYEEFDASPYEEDPPPAYAVIVHDVPENLMKPSVGDESRLQGFKIQIFSSQDKAEADALAAQTSEWLRELHSKGELDGIYGRRSPPAPIDPDFRSPNYRVRLGNFRTREVTERMLTIIEARFPEAFIVPPPLNRNR